MIDQSDLADYFKRSGDTELLKGNFEQNEKGFCIWTTNKDMLMLLNVYGDGKYWNEWATNKARETGMKKILFATKRNPEGFVRKHGFNVIGYILERYV